MARWAADHVYMMHRHARHAIASRKTLLLWRAAGTWRLMFKSAWSKALAAPSGSPRQRHERPLACAQVAAAEQVYQTDISTSSSQEKHYHPKRLLITLNEHPTQEQAQRSAILPEVSSTGLLPSTE